VRILFLDIDGVLNSHAFVHRAGWHPPLGSDRDLYIIDPVAVALLNGVLEETGAVVVITSSWRSTYPQEALHSMLQQRGFTGQVVGTTPELPGRRRSREIAQWLVDHADVEAFAIVDDDEDAGAGHPHRFVRTTYQVGLTGEHASALVRVLTTSPL